MLKRPVWRERTFEFSGLPPTVTTMLENRARTICLDKGSVIFGPGKPTENLLLLVSGTVRVQQLSKDGHQISFYRVHAGDSCVLTTACLMAFGYCYTECLSETDIEAVLFPRDAFDELMWSSKEFRAFMFEAYSKRITDLFQVTEETAQRRVH